MIQSPKRIWIDCDNSPHVLFFKPIITELTKRGYEIEVTARHFSQTMPLLREFCIDHKVVGKHYGKNKLVKIVGTFIRAFQLMRLNRNKSYDLSIVHSSRALPIASFLKKLPNIAMLDYEYADLYVFKWFSSKIFIPEVINEKIAESVGLPRNRIIRYPGFKENVYLCHFEPHDDVILKVGLDPNKIIVVIRPPATMAHYHTREGEYFFKKVVQLACSRLDTQVILLFRTVKQRYRWSKVIENLSCLPKIPQNVVSGLDLIYHADLVISGGGTMVREAAVMGVPSYSIFLGKKGAVDTELEKMGRLTFLNNEEEFSKLEFKKKSPIDLESLRDKKAFNFIITQIEQLVL